MHTIAFLIRDEFKNKFSVVIILHSFLHKVIKEKHGCSELWPTHSSSGSEVEC